MAFLAPRSHPSGQRRAKQREQTLPMPLRCGLVVCRPLREGEAMVGAGVDFHLGVAAVSVEFEAQLVDRLARRVLTGFGAAEIQPRVRAMDCQVRAIGLIGYQGGTINRRRRSDLVAMAHCRVDCISTAHTVPDTSP